MSGQSESIAIAYTQESSRKEATFHGTCGGTNLALERALRLLAKKLEVTIQDFKVCYEAGPTGFVLARRLNQLKVETTVMSPPKTERKAKRRLRQINAPENGAKSRLLGAPLADPGGRNYRTGLLAGRAFRATSVSGYFCV